jgi:signal transduction histidine kinase
MSGGHSVQTGVTPRVPAIKQSAVGDDSLQSFSTDLQSLLSGALQNLAQATGSSRAGAWARRPDGETFVVAAAFRDGSNPEAPDPESIALLESACQIDRPIDLGEAGPDSPLYAMANRYGFSSAMSLRATDEDPIAIMMLGGPDDPPGQVRPRTLAALDTSVGRLRSPAVAASAYSRLNRLDADVCRLDRLAVLGDLLAEVAHEIRNPLVSMKTFLDLLPDHLSDPEFHGEFRQVVLQELNRMERLLGTLLDHARPVANHVLGHSNPGASNIESVFATIVRLLDQRARDFGIELCSKIDEALPELAIDPDALRQILLNLVLNALEASPESTKVILCAERLDPEHDPNTIEFSIEDQGSGVPEESREKLFEPFFTTRETTAGGLGLAISKKLVEEAGGTIRVEAGRTGGARFCVRLPARTSG